MRIPVVAPGSISVRVSPDMDAIAIRDGVEGGMATVAIPLQELKNAVVTSGAGVRSLVLHDGSRELHLIDPPVGSNVRLAVSNLPVGNGNLVARVGIKQQRVTTLDRLMLLLPVLMWVTAALVTWLLVSRLLLRPLKRLESAVTQYQSGPGGRRASAPAWTFDRNPGAT